MRAGLALPAEQEHGRSLEALDGILELVVSGPLRNKPGLEPLYRELLRYYEKLIERQQESEAGQREKLANACLRLGKLIRKTGQLSDALAALDRGERLARRLADDQPDEPRLAHQLARALLERSRALDEARDYQRDLGEALHELAALRSQEEADPAEALHLFAWALALRKQLCRQPDALPTDLRDLARTHGYLGDLLLRLDRLAEADLAY